jgi:hypothetical protein
VPLSRRILKNVIFPRVPLKPLALFVYMYIARLGFLDGRPGFVFCILHAWHEFVIGQLQRLGVPAEIMFEINDETCSSEH